MTSVGRCLYPVSNTFDLSLNIRTHTQGSTTQPRSAMSSSKYNARWTPVKTVTCRDFSTTYSSASNDAESTHSNYPVRWRAPLASSTEGELGKLENVSLCTSHFPCLHIATLVSPYLETPSIRSGICRTPVSLYYYYLSRTLESDILTFLCSRTRPENHSRRPRTHPRLQECLLRHRPSHRDVHPAPSHHNPQRRQSGA